MSNASQMLDEATRALLAALQGQGQGRDDGDGDGVPFPPRLDDLVIEDLSLIRWRVLAPPAQVEAVTRCYGEAVATLLYAECDARAEGQPLDDDIRRRMFIRSLKSRFDRLGDLPRNCHSARCTP